MGNDVRTITPASLSILSNAAVIAVNQDPLGSSASRKWQRTLADPSVPYPGPALQLWAGDLKSTTGGDWNDVVVLLVNGAEETVVINATLAEIFEDSGPAGTAEQV